MRLPSALMSASNESKLTCVPSLLTLTSVVVCATRSRTNTSACPLVSSGTRLSAVAMVDRPLGKSETVMGVRINLDLGIGARQFHPLFTFSMISAVRRCRFRRNRNRARPWSFARQDADCRAGRSQDAFRRSTRRL